MISRTTTGILFPGLILNSSSFSGVFQPSTAGTHNPLFIPGVDGTDSGESAVSAAVLLATAII